MATFVNYFCTIICESVIKLAPAVSFVFSCLLTFSLPETFSISDRRLLTFQFNSIVELLKSINSSYVYSL